MIKLQFSDGSFVRVPADVGELDKVTVTKSDGSKMQVRWGSVIAHSNGEAIQLLREATGR